MVNFTLAHKLSDVRDLKIERLKRQVFRDVSWRPSARPKRRTRHTFFVKLLRRFAKRETLARRLCQPIALAPRTPYRRLRWAWTGHGREPESSREVASTGISSVITIAARSASVRRCGPRWPGVAPSEMRRQDSSSRERRLNVFCCLQDKRVVTIGGVGIALGKCVIDEDGKIESLAISMADVECRILVDTHRSSHPVENELGIFRNGSRTDNACPLAKRLTESSHEFFRRHRHRLLTIRMCRVRL